MLMSAPQFEIGEVLFTKWLVGMRSAYFAAAAAVVVVVVVLQNHKNNF